MNSSFDVLPAVVSLIGLFHIALRSDCESISVDELLYQVPDVIKTTMMRIQHHGSMAKPSVAAEIFSVKLCEEEKLCK